LLEIKTNCNAKSLIKTKTMETPKGYLIPDNYRELTDSKD